MVVKKNVIFEITNLATPKEGLMLNDQANQEKGFIRMQNQVKSVTTVF